MHRWRAAGRLGEIRAADLRLTASEVAQLVGKVGVEISPDDAAVLTARTEGWAAGVQLAALSMRHESAPAQFIHNFAGTDRNVADFLVGEVLRRQPEELVTFLLETSVLDELSAPFCDAITGRSDSSVVLADLERENLFVIPLDNEQTLYRYHHLFAELLRKLLAARHPERLPELHRAASNWYARHDDPRRAVRHAILARDPALVTELLRGGVLSGFFTGAGEMIRDWINDLSRAHIEMSPELMIEYALALGLVGGFEDARAWLGRADEALAGDTTPMLRARLALARAITIGSLGDVEPAMRSAEAARELAGVGVDPLIDTGSRYVLLRCNLYLGNIATARALYDEDRAQPGDPTQLNRVLMDGMFSQVELEAGELHAAGVAAESCADAVAKLDGESHPGANDAFRTLGALAYEYDRLDEAEALFDRCVTLVWNGRPIFLLLSRLELGRIWNARGDLESALIELDLARAAARGLHVTTHGSGRRVPCAHPGRERQDRRRAGDHLATPRRPSAIGRADQASPRRTEHCRGRIAAGRDRRGESISKGSARICPPRRPSRARRGLSGYRSEAGARARSRTRRRIHPHHRRRRPGARGGARRNPAPPIRRRLRGRAGTGARAHDCGGFRPQCSALRRRDAQRTRADGAQVPRDRASRRERSRPSSTCR